MRRSSERFARQHQFSPPPSFRLASTYPRIDRPASGLKLLIPSLHNSAPHKKEFVACKSLSLRLQALAFSLTNSLNSPARFSKRKIQYLLEAFYTVSVYCWLVLGSFHFSSKVLFSFRSRYYSTIGLKTYLELDVNATQIRAPYPRHGTQECLQSSFQLPSTGLSPSMAWRSSQLRVGWLRSNKLLPLHIFPISL